VAAVDLTPPAPLRLCVLLFPFTRERGRYALQSQFIHVMAGAADRVVVLAGEVSTEGLPGHVRVVPVIVPTASESAQPLRARVWRFLQAQVPFARALWRERREFEVMVFMLSTGLLPVALLLGRLLGKRVVTIATGSHARSFAALHPGAAGEVGSRLVGRLEHLAYRLSHVIGVYTPGVVPELGLERFGERVARADRGYVDAALFSATVPLQERPLRIAYVGRLEGEKGIVELLQALPLLLQRCPELTVVIAGDGSLAGRVRQTVEALESQRVRYLGPLPHRCVGRLLNAVRLLVLPSQTEAFPGVIYEAWACGTPVLASAVGGIPDMIREGESGFLLPGNAPGEIAAAALRALRSDRLQAVSDAGRRYVAEQLSLGAVVARYREVLRHP